MGLEAPSTVINRLLAACSPNTAIRIAAEPVELGSPKPCTLKPTPLLRPKLPSGGLACVSPGGGVYLCRNIQSTEMYRASTPCFSFLGRGGSLRKWGA